MTTYSVCIATLNRRDALLRSIAHVMTQTRLPVQIVIVDSSDDWFEARDAVAGLVDRHPDITLDYIHSPIRSSATQRNEGISRCRGEVIVILDDDCFMYPDCAEAVLRVYEADTDQAIASAQITMVDTVPVLPNDSASSSLTQKTSGNRGGLAKLRRIVLKSSFGRWFHRRILMQSMEEIFLRYDGPRQSPLPDVIWELGARPVSLMSGGATAVRRNVALAEPLETCLRYYAALEDLDASYRYAKHGHLIIVPEARLHHFEAASGRIKRKKVAVFQLLNMIVFLKRHAEDPKAWRQPYRILMYRRLLGEFLKDALSGRWQFPQMRGVLLARRYAKAVWECPTPRLDEWYPRLQKQILDEV